MLHTHPALRERCGDGGGAAWVRHCRMWEPAIAAHRPRRRIYWLSLPLETEHRRLLDTVVGRDKDTDAALAGYRARAAELIGALPGVFFPKPVSAEQIWWHWNYTASRGVWQPPAAAAALRSARQPARPRRSPPSTSTRPPRSCGADGGAPPAPRPTCSCAPTATPTTACPTPIRR